MEYREFGKTGKRVSRLGLGAMRLPETHTALPLGAAGRLVRRAYAKGVNVVLETLGSARRVSRVDSDAAGELIRYALARGVNFIDTAYIYTGSEQAIGRAVADLNRSTFFVQTKAPLSVGESPGAFRRCLEHSLQRLGMDYVDLFLAHGACEAMLNGPLWDFISEARKAQSEGLVRHIGFSSHDKPAGVLRLIETHEFDCMLVQYNLLDTNYTVPIAHAHVQGMGVATMGPLAGGRLVKPPEAMKRLRLRVDHGVEPGLRFVLANDNIDVALSGVSAISQLDENLEIASDMTPVSEEERQQFELIVFEHRNVGDLRCTRCGYCMPCSEGVDIPGILQLALYLKLYDLREYAAEQYRLQRDTDQGADRCSGCGECEAKCPQALAIADLLRQTHHLLVSTRLSRK